MTNPTNLIAINSGLNVQLTWTAGLDVDGYTIYRNGTFIGDVDSPSTSFLDTTALPGTTYTYGVIGFGACGYTAEITTNHTTACTPPQDVNGIDVVQIDSTHLLISWTGVENAAGYVLQVNVNGSGWTTKVTTSDTSYTDSVIIGDAYQYRVYSYNACANGTPYPSGTVTPTCATYSGPPTSVNLTVLSETQVQITFDEVYDENDNPVTNYVIQRRTASGGYSTIATITYADLPYVDSGLSSNTEYCYRIQASGGVCVSSDYSPEQCITTFSPLPCNSPDNTFDWTVARFCEPGACTSQILEDNLHISPHGSIDLSDPRIVGIEFGPNSVLDDILILTKAGDDVTEIWDGIPGDEHTYILPTPCILFANTFGFYNNPTIPGAYGASSKKTIIQMNGSTVVHKVVLPYGDNDISSLSFDTSGNVILGIVGFRGSPSCLAINGTFTLIMLSSTLYQDPTSDWSMSLTGTAMTSDYIWGIYEGTTLMYAADANVNPTPPMNTNQWIRQPNNQENIALGCQNSTGPNGMNIQDLADAGFVVRDFATGVSKADLISMGFVSPDGTFSFEFAHICCGVGNVTIDGLTCTDGNNPSSSCSPPGAPTGLTASVDCNAVSLNWTDHSGGTASTVIYACNNLNGIWSLVTIVPPGTSHYTDYEATGGYTYRAYAQNGCGTSGYSNYAYVCVPCICTGSNPPRSIQISFEDVTACSCYTTESGSTTTVITSLSGPYTLTGDGVTQSWTGLAGVVTTRCHTSDDCSDVSPTISSGPVNISVSISGSTLSVSASITGGCCSGSPVVFSSTATIDCKGGLFVLNNSNTEQSDCSCTSVVAFGGQAVVSIVCGTLLPCNTYTVSFSNLTADSECLPCETGSFLYESDSVNDHTFTLTRSLTTPGLFSYETTSSLPVNIRHYTSNNCTGSFTSPTKFGIYMNYDQVSGDYATLTAKAFMPDGTSIVLFTNTVGVPVTTSSFVIPNSTTEFTCGTSAYIMWGGCAEITQGCTSISSSGYSSSTSSSQSCYTCCQSYIVVLSASAWNSDSQSHNNPNNTYVLTSNGSSCLWSWSEGAATAGISIVSGEWNMTISDGTKSVTWTAPLSSCPPTNSDQWTVGSNNWITGGLAFTITTAECPSGSSSGGGCSSCCSTYGIAISASVWNGDSQSFNDPNTPSSRSLTKNGCVWSWSGSDGAFATIESSGIGWTLVVSDGDKIITWSAPESTCPPTNASGWVLTSNNWIPTGSLTVSACGSSSSSSSSTSSSSCVRCGTCSYVSNSTTSVTWTFPQPPAYSSWSSSVQTLFDSISSGSATGTFNNETPTSAVWTTLWTSSFSTGTVSITYNCTDAYWSFSISNSEASISVQMGATGFCTGINYSGGTPGVATFTANGTNYGTVPNAGVLIHVSNICTIVDTCGTPETTFSWTIPSAGEPGLIFDPYDTPSTPWPPPVYNLDYFVRESPTGSINMADPTVIGLSFGADPSTTETGPDLDDILVMMKPGDSIITTWDGIAGHAASFILPNNCIIIAANDGWAINSTDYWGRYSCQKTFTEDGTTHTATFLAGAPEGAGVNGAMGTPILIAGGFFMQYFTTGILKSDLMARGFIDELGNCNFKFGHIMSGSGQTSFSMTCYKS